MLQPWVHAAPCHVEALALLQAAGLKVDRRGERGRQDDGGVVCSKGMVRGRVVCGGSGMVNSTDRLLLLLLIFSVMFIDSSEFSLEEFLAGERLHHRYDVTSDRRSWRDWHYASKFSRAKLAGICFGVIYCNLQTHKNIIEKKFSKYTVNTITEIIENLFLSAHMCAHNLMTVI